MNIKKKIIIIYLAAQLAAGYPVFASGNPGSLLELEKRIPRRLPRKRRHPPRSRK